jgi:diaminopimelate epimerase
VSLGESQKSEVRSQIGFAKVQSIGNDFVLVEADSSLDYPALAERVGVRHFGIGSDGLLVVTPGEPLGLRMFNPDGTEDFCGNGLRCAALYARTRGYVTGDRFEIHQLGRTIPVEMNRDEIVTTLSPGSYEPAEVPVDSPTPFVDSPLEVAGRTYRVHAVSTGSTHLVIPVAELPGDDEFEEVSPLLEHHPLFPERTSIMWMQEVAPDHVRLRIWERGAGETMGCGTGSTAAAIVHARRTGFSGAIRVENPGGSLKIELSSWDAAPRITGRAQIVFTGLYFIGIGFPSFTYF